MDDFDCDMFEPYESDTAIYEWEDREYNVDLISELETSHLINIVRGIKRGAWYFGQGYKLERINKELKKRIKNYNGEN